eukprot:SAG11_NODE_1491_length_4810_cov_1.999363_5_plen_74_part_00
MDHVVGPEQITCNVVQPGAMYTVGQERALGLDSTQRDDIAPRIPARRMGTPGHPRCILRAKPSSNPALICFSA